MQLQLQRNLEGGTHSHQNINWYTFQYKTCIFLEELSQMFIYLLRMTILQESECCELLKSKFNCSSTSLGALLAPDSTTLTLALPYLFGDLLAPDSTTATLAPPYL